MKCRICNVIRPKLHLASEPVRLAFQAAEVSEGGHSTHSREQSPKRPKCRGSKAGEGERGRRLTPADRWQAGPSQGLLTTTSCCGPVRTSIGSWQVQLPLNLRRQHLSQTEPTTVTKTPLVGNFHRSIATAAVGSLGCALTRLGQDERVQPRVLLAAPSAAWRCSEVVCGSTLLTK